MAERIGSTTFSVFGVALAPRYAEVDWLSIPDADFHVLAKAAMCDAGEI